MREEYTSFLLQPLLFKASVIYSVSNTYEISGQSCPRLDPTAPGKFKVMVQSPDTWASRFVSTRRKFSFILGQNKVDPLPSSLDKRLCENPQDTGKELITRLQSQCSSQHLSHLQEKCHLNSISARNQKGCLPHSTKTPHLSPHFLPPRNHYFSWSHCRKVRRQGAPPRYWNSNSTQRHHPPPPRISCQGYQRSSEGASAGQVAQVCSVKCKVL